MDSIQVFILAAGSSSRLGQPKQLIKIKGKYLINHTIDIVLETGLQNVSVILGANMKKIATVIQNRDIEILDNSNWFKGMSSSFRTAMNNIASKEIKAALFLISDQPLLTKKVLIEIINNYSQNRNSIISCNYGKSIGPPTLFTRNYFKEIKNLKGDSGAKSIIIANIDKLIEVDFPGGEKDIDNMEDLEFFNTD